MRNLLKFYVSVISLANCTAYAQQDPAFTFSTYLGGSDFEYNGGVAVDRNGNVFVTGVTSSQDFPVLNSIQPFRGGTFPGTDAFIVKIDSMGQLVYSTFIGGTGDELVNSIAVDSMGAVYIAGTTNSIDFPVRDSLQVYQGSPLLRTDAFVLKLNPQGSEIEFATLLGGTGDEMITDLAVDRTGGIYLVGSTNSFDFPTTQNAFQSQFSGRANWGVDAFAAKLTVQGSQYQYAYCTLLGGSNDEFGLNVATDPEGRLYLAGFTFSHDFPLRDPVQAAIADSDTTSTGDAFVTAFSPEGDFLYFSTYLGGEFTEKCSGITVDDEGRIFVSGQTVSSNFPISPFAFQPTIEDEFDAFVVSYQKTKNGWEYGPSTLMGSGGTDLVGDNIVLGVNGGIILSGTTDTFQFPAVAPFMIEAGGGKTDVFIAQMSADLTTVKYGVLIGGSDHETVHSLSSGSSGKWCVTGMTHSKDLPVLNALQESSTHDSGFDLNLGDDIYVFCIEAGEMTGLGAGPGLSSLAMRAFPNPASDQITLEYRIPEGGLVTLELYDILGRKMRTLYAETKHSGGQYMHTFNVHMLSPGIYTCSLKFKSISVLCKIVIE